MVTHFLAVILRFKESKLLQISEKGLTQLLNMGNYLCSLMIQINLTSTSKHGINLLYYN